MIKFINENRFLTFVIIMTSVNLILFNIKHQDYIFILIFVSVIISLLIDKIGHLMQYISLNKLIKSLEESNLKLKKSEQIFRDFFTQTNIPMCIFNLKTLKFVKVNRFLCDLLEYSEDELINKNLNDLIFPDDLKDSIRVVELNIDKIKEDRHINRYITKSGKIAKLHWTFTEGDEDNISYCVALPIN